MANRVGQQFGNYRLVSLLGYGGFAEVYLGEHQYLKTQAAIKVLSTHLSDSEPDTFLREARTVARLKHPHIVHVVDFDVQEGVPFLVLSYAANGTLRQRHPKGTQVPLHMIVDYVKQIADALQYAHDEKLIHRDIKPENMLLGEHDEVLLSDFGLALLFQGSRLQSTQEVTGTACYMAPEQVRGKPRFASDQYALGIMAYEWICGEPPFHGSFIQVCSQHLFLPPPPLHEKVPTISPLLEEVVLTALSKEPEKRFASVKAFAMALEQAYQEAINHPAVLTAELPTLNQPLPPPDTEVTASRVQLSLPMNVDSPPDQPFLSADIADLSSHDVLHSPSSPLLLPDPRPTLSLPPLEPDEAPTYVNISHHIRTSPLKNPAPVAKPRRTAPFIKHVASNKSRMLLWLAFLVIVAASIVWGYLPLTRQTSAIFTTHATVMPTVHSTVVPTVHPTSTALLSPPVMPTTHTSTASYTMFGFDTQHTHFNSYEHTLTPKNVSQLVQDWVVSTHGEVYSSPTVVDGVVYVGSSDSYLYALNATTGKLLWKAKTGDWIRSSPTVVNGVVYVGSFDSYLYAFKASTGGLLWRAHTGGAINSSPTVDHGIVYVGSQDANLYAFKASGCGNSLCSPLWTATTGGAIYYSSPTVVDGIVYLGSQDAKLYAFKASGCGSSSCPPLWIVPLGNCPYSSSSLVTNGIVATPMVVNGIVYVGSCDSNLYALNSATGKAIWAVPAHTGGGIRSSPAEAYGIVYVGSDDDNLYAFDAATGKQLWHAAARDVIRSSPTVANGVVYVGSDDDNLYAFDAATGKQLWKTSTGNLIYSSPAVINGVVYVGSKDFNVYAFHLPGTTP